MANQLFNSGKKKLMEGSIALATDTIKAALFASSLTPNIDTQVFFSDLTGEISNSGYTAGGQALTSKAITIDTANDRAYLDADDVSWTAGVGGITARYLVLYKDTGNPASSPLVGILDYITDRSVPSGDVFYNQWAAPAVGAIFYLT